MSKTSPKVTPSKGEAEEDGQGWDSNELIEVVSKEITEEEFDQITKDNSDIYQSPVKFLPKDFGFGSMEETKTSTGHLIEISALKSPEQLQSKIKSTKIEAKGWKPSDAAAASAKTAESQSASASATETSSNL